jgi:hypothetical protein
MEIDPQFIIIRQIDMASPLIEVDLIAGPPLEEVKPHEKVGQPRLQVEGIGGGDQEFSSPLKNSKAFPDKKERGLQMFNAIGTENEVEALILKGEALVQIGLFARDPFDIKFLRIDIRGNHIKACRFQSLRNSPISCRCIQQPPSMAKVGQDFNHFIMGMLHSKNFGYQSPDAHRF